MLDGQSIVVRALSVLVGACCFAVVLPFTAFGAKASHEYSPPACYHAEVSLGDRPGVIRFSVSCRATASGGHVGFSLRRGLRRSGIVRVSRRPLVLGLGGRRSTGRCKLTAEGAGCSAVAYKKVRIFGTLWVRRGTRCSRKTEIFVFRHSQCVGGECLPRIGVRRLVNIKPRGC